MKTFTAKQFSRSPAQVFDAAREDGRCEITHDRHYSNFTIQFNAHPIIQRNYEIKDILINTKEEIDRFYDGKLSLEDLLDINEKRSNKKPSEEGQITGE